MGSDAWADTGEMLGGGGCALVYCRSCAEAERVCDGLTEADALARFPDVMHGRNADKLRFRYPKGESYVDLMERVGRECAAFDAELQSRAKNRSGSGSHNPKTQGW